MIYIYDDCLHNNFPLLRYLENCCAGIQIRFVSADELLGGCLQKRPPALFVMPGGASRYVSDKLAGQGNSLIRAYVEQGGSYLGICAGAYYACQRILWNQTGSQPLSAIGELNFAEGAAVGPIEGFTNRDGDAVSYARLATLDFADGHSAKALYWGGPLLPDAPGLTVLARYRGIPAQAGTPNDAPAIVTGAHGRGKFLLSSPHCEMTPASLRLIQFDVPYNANAAIRAIDAALLDAHVAFGALVHAMLM